jgi:predicted secreted protein
MSSRRVVFVPHCLLNQSVRSLGRENSSVKEVVKFFADAEVGMVQLPCPEVEFDGGLERKAKPKECYDRIYRRCCRKVSAKILTQIRRYLERDYNVLGILGVEFSPTCGVYRVENGRKVVPGKGILMEEIEKGMQSQNFQVPIISVNTSNVFSTLEKLSMLLKNS